jgi:putative PEP-CTERM system histidine kinase
VFGYLISALAHGLLLTACLTVWRRRLAGSGVAPALSVQLGWSLVLASQGARLVVPLGFIIAVEYLRDLAWALVLARCLPGSDPASAVRAARRVLAVLVGLTVLGAAASLLPGLADGMTAYLERYWLWGGLLFSIAGLVLVEQVARNTRSTQRWALKHLWLGIGALYVWDLGLFSIAMLHGSATHDFWIARGFVNALVAALIGVALRRVPQWESATFLSPRIVFFNTTLLGAAFYVFVMAAGSYYVRWLGGTWGETAQILFIATGALVLAVTVLSEQFRAWTRVMIAKHFFPYRYDYRAEWQRLTRALSEANDTPVYERIVSVMSGFVSAPSGGLWLRDAEGGYAPAGGELAPPGASRETGSKEFFEYLREREWIYDLDEARDRHARKPSVQPPGWMLASSRMWLIVPLICEESLVGFVAVGYPLAPPRLTWEELDLLRAAGRQVASYLAFEQAAKRLAEAHQFEALNRLSAIIMHDLRHLIAQQALVVENAARHRGNPDFFDDAILTIDHSVKRMTRLMDELRSGALAEETHRVELSELCHEVVGRCAQATPKPRLQVRERRVEVVLNRERLLQALEHLIRNAQQATPQDGAVTVSVGRSGSQAMIEIADTGSGMDAEFVRHRLFRPFDTTKGERGFGIGAYQAREFIRKCGGGIEVESIPGKGTIFNIRLPLAPGLGTLSWGNDQDELEAN